MDFLAYRPYPKCHICVAAFLVIAIVLSGCTHEQDTRVDSTPTTDELLRAQAEVDSVVERFGRMWEDEDMSTFSRLMAHDADLVVIGTDAAEQIVGYDEYARIRRQQFASFENVEFDVRNRVIKLGADARTAWFSEEFDLLVLANGEPVSLEGLRLTGGLEKRDSSWVIVQLHTSVPVPGQAAEY